jgi:hypothetical protein
MRRLLALLLFGAVGCSTGVKTRVMRTALDDRESRQEWLDATLRVLDENPEYVDEFYAQARSHRGTLDRFIENAARDLDQEWLATLTARHLANNPESLRRVLIAALDEARDDRAVRDAVAQAIAERQQTSQQITLENPELIQKSLAQTLEAARDDEPVRRAILSTLGENVELSAELISQDPELVYATLRATVGAVLARPEARRAFVLAMSAESPRLGRLIANNPKLLARMMRQLLTEARRDPALLKRLLPELTE